MTAAAADLRFGDIGQAQETLGPHVDAASKAEQAGGHAGLEHQVRTRVGQVEAGNSTAAAQVRPPGRAARVLRDQAAFLPVAAALKVLEVVRALGAGRRSQGGPDQTRVRYCPVRVSTRI